MPNMTRVEPKFLAAPRKPSKERAVGANRALHTKFPAVILNNPDLGESRSKTYEGGKMNEKTNTYMMKGAKFAFEEGIARWFDHRYLIRHRATPDELPSDVRAHIMAAVEDMRAGHIVERTGIKYEIDSLVDKDVKGKGSISGNTEFLLNGFGFGDLPKKFEESDEHGLDEDEIKTRYALETAGVLMAIRFMECPIRHQVQQIVDRTFHPRMKFVVETIDDLMIESDLSFSDAHQVGRCLEALLSDLPNNPSPPPAPPPREAPAGAIPTPKAPDRPPEWDRLSENKEKIGDILETSRKDLKDTVNWDNIGSFTRYSGNVSSQLRKVITQIGDGYNRYYRTGRKPSEDWFTSLPRPGYLGYGTYARYGAIAKKDSLLKESHSVKWGTMRVQTPRLTHTTVKPRDCGRDHRHIARESGRVPRFMHRFLSDGRVFSQKKRRRGGIALLIDMSGSMCLSMTDMDNILRKIPASIIAGYAGHGVSGTLRVIGKDGRRVTREVADVQGGMNVVDLPALQWLARQGNAGKYWLSDGIVTGRYDSNGPGNYKEVDDFICENDIYQVSCVSRLLAVIFEGKELEKRTLQKHLAGGEGLLTTT